MGVCREVWRDFVPPRLSTCGPPGPAKPAQVAHKRGVGEAKPPQTPPLCNSCQLQEGLKIIPQDRLPLAGAPEPKPFI